MLERNFWSPGRRTEARQSADARSAGEHCLVGLRAGYAIGGETACTLPVSQLRVGDASEVAVWLATDFALHLGNDGAGRAFANGRVKSAPCGGAALPIDRQS